MKKKAKPMELVTVLLTWCDSIRGKGAKSEGEKRREVREVRCGMCGVRCLKTHT